MNVYRVTSPYNSDLVAGPLVAGDLVYFDEDLAGRINADAAGTLELEPGEPWHAAVNVQPDQPLVERQRELDRELGRGPGVVTTLPHARRPKQ